MSKSKKNEVNFSLAAIELLKASLNHPEKKIPAQINFQFDISLEHKFRLEENIFLVITKIDVSNDDKSALLGSLSSSCVFRIDNLNEFVNGANKIKFHQHFIDTLNSISISTTRGMMFSHFRGTFLHNAHLPVIDPKKMRPKNLT